MLEGVIKALRSVLGAIRPFICRPVSGNLVDGGIQWSATVTTVDADTDYNLDYCAYELGQSGKIDGKATGGVVEFSIVVGIKSSAATPSGKIRLQARNKGGTWVDILPLTGAISLTTAEQEKAYGGYFPTVANFNAVPFDLRLAIQSDNATNHAIGRIKNASFVRGEFEPDT